MATVVQRGAERGAENFKFQKTALESKKSDFKTPCTMPPPSHFLQLVLYKDLKASLETFADERTHVNVPGRYFLSWLTRPHRKRIQEKLHLRVSESPSHHISIMSGLPSQQR